MDPYFMASQRQQYMDNYSYPAHQVAYGQQFMPPNPLQQQEVLSEPKRDDIPEWMVTPCRPSWTIGSRLITYSLSNEKQMEAQYAVNVKHNLSVFQVITEPEFVTSAVKLDNALTNDNLMDYCMYKMNECYGKGDQKLTLAWRLLATHFYPDEAEKLNDIMNLLGYPNANNLAQSFSMLDTSSSRLSDKSTVLDSTVQSSPCDSPTKRHEDVMATENLQRSKLLPLKIETPKEGDDDLGPFLNKCLLTGDLDKAIEKCLKDKKWPEAFMLTWFTSPTSLPNVLSRYLEQASSDTKEWSSLLWFTVCSRLPKEVHGAPESSEVLQRLVESVSLMYWKETVAYVFRESMESDLGRNREQLVDLLGHRVQQLAKDAKSEAWLVPALYCFILSANYENVASHCQPACGIFQNVIEIVLVIQKAISRKLSSSPTANKLIAEYAEKLVVQGKLQLALTYLTQFNSNEELKRRLELHFRPTAPNFPRMSSVRGRQYGNRYPNQVPLQRMPQQLEQVPRLPGSQYGAPQISNLYQPFKPPQATYGHMTPVNNFGQVNHPPVTPVAAIPTPNWQQTNVAYPPRSASVREGMYQGMSSDYNYPSRPESTFSAYQSGDPNRATPLFQPQYTNQTVFQAKAVVPSVQRIELSPEDEEVMTVYEELLQTLNKNLQSVSVTANIRRKVDDILTKLDLMRAKFPSLPEKTKSGFKEMSLALKEHDYAKATKIHTDIVASSTFSETAGFLPSLKVLVHLAHQYVH
ncbi:Protein transport protein Sec31A [Halotydeus destructor]|nr:Protein transport protein Sec31A [Halotydeus destructor]